MTRAIQTVLAGAALAAAFAAPVAAHPRLEQTGDGYSLAYDGADRGGIAGGREARLVGGGDGAVLLYFGPEPAREGRSATLSGGGDNAVLSYAEPAAAPARAMARGETRRAAAGHRG
jgi:hypothetical protein